jgi:hypothetical protein
MIGADSLLWNLDLGLWKLQLGRLLGIWSFRFGITAQPFWDLEPGIWKFRFRRLFFLAGNPAADAR